MENGHQVKGGGAANVSSECCVGLDDGEKIAKIGKPLWSWRATRSWIIMRIVHVYIMNRGLNRLVVHKYRTWLFCVFFNLIEFADRRRSNMCVESVLRIINWRTRGPVGPSNIHDPLPFPPGLFLGRLLLVLSTISKAHEIRSCL